MATVYYTTKLMRKNAFIHRAGMKKFLSIAEPYWNDKGKKVSLVMTGRHAGHHKDNAS